MPNSVRVSIATGMQVLTKPESDIIGLLFRTNGTEEQVGVGLPTKEASSLVSLLLKHAAEYTDKSQSEIAQNEFTAIPVMASHMGVGRGRSESEALIVLKVGMLDLTFAVELSMLTGICADLKNMTREKNQTKPLN